MSEEANKNGCIYTDPPAVDVSESAQAYRQYKQVEENLSKPALTPQEENALHNKACLDAANAVIRTNQAMNYERVKSLMPEPAMVNLIADTLTEAKAADQLARYDFGALPLFLAKLKTLTFLEQVDLSRRVNNEISRWEDCKTALECIEDMRIDDKGNKELMKINSMNNFGYHGTQESFSKDYVEKMDQLKKIAAVLAACIDSNKEGLGTTSFTTREMIALMEKRASEKSLEPGSEKEVAYANHVVEIFKHRTDNDFLVNRLMIYLKTNKKNLKKSFVEIKGNTMPKCMKTLIKIFGNDTMYRVWYTLITTHIDNNADAVFVLFSFLAKLVETEKRTGDAVWAKVFILNISDCQRNVFDLKDQKSYINTIWNGLGNAINKFISDNKIDSRITPGFNYAFRLRTPEEYINAIPEYADTYKWRILQEYADERQKAIEAAKAAAEELNGETITPEEPSNSTEGVPNNHQEFKSTLLGDIERRMNESGIRFEEVLEMMSLDEKKTLMKEIDSSDCPPIFTRRLVELSIEDDMKTQEEKTVDPVLMQLAENFNEALEKSGFEPPKEVTEIMKNISDEDFKKAILGMDKAESAKDQFTTMVGDAAQAKVDGEVEAAQEAIETGKPVSERLQSMLIPNNDQQ